MRRAGEGRPGAAGNIGARGGRRDLAMGSGGSDADGWCDLGELEDAAKVRKAAGVPSFFPPLFAPPRLLSSVRIGISPGIRPIVQLAQERLKVLHRLDASWLSRPWDEVRRTLDFPTSSPSFSKRRVPTFIRG